MKIQRVNNFNKYRDFVTAKKLYKESVIHYKQEQEIKFSKQKILNLDEDFDESEFKTAETDKSLNEAIANVLKSVYKEFLSYFI